MEGSWLRSPLHTNYHAFSAEGQTHFHIFVIVQLKILLLELNLIL
jgi:hypothetical protein